MIIRLLVLTLLVLLGGFALAQAVGGDVDPTVATGVLLWFGSAAAFAGAVITPTVSFVKTNILKNLHGMGTLALSFGLGIAGGIVGSVWGPIDGIAAGLAFGVNAAILASGGWDALVGILGKRQAAG